MDRRVMPFAVALFTGVGVYGLAYQALPRPGNRRRPDPNALP
jgi:hypothetical protein